MYRLKDLIDYGVYINLPHRIDKNDAMQKQLLQLGLDDTISKIDGVYPKDLGFKPNDITQKYEIIEYSTAAAKAHRNIIEIAKKNNYKNVLVLEDDTLFVDNGVDNLINALLNLKKYDNWELLYVGGDCNDIKFDFYGKNLVKVKNISCSHAYVVNNTFYDKILNFKETITHFDCILNNLSNEKYLTYPLSIVQRHINKTDIGETDCTFERPYWEKTYLNKNYE
jgi:glycosyl transferase family 25